MTAQRFDVVMPQLGETVSNGTILRWFKASGETVVADEPLFEIETEKVSMEIPAPVSGVLGAILVPEGETVDVGTKVAEIELRAGAQGSVSAPTAPVSRDEKGVSAAADAAASEASGRERLSPAVRRLLQEHGLTAAEVRGTGAGGRITREDVLAHVAGRDTDKRSVPVQSGTLVPFTAMRKRIAEHMVRSKAVSPHVLQAVEVDFTRVAQARSELGEQWKSRHGFSLTYLPFVAWAVSRALQKFPRANATVEGEALRLHSSVNLCIAVDVNQEGLLTPVVANAERASVPELAERIHDLAARARANALKPDELTGGTYTISNSGGYGTLLTAPIINQPQVAILSMDGVSRKPVAVQQDGREAIEIRPVGVLAQSFDHRAFDGAYSAAFLGEVRRIIEQTDWLPEVNRG